MENGISFVKSAVAPYTNVLYVSVCE